MKKIVSFILMTAFLLCLIGCGKQTPEQVNTIESNLKTYYELSDLTNRHLFTHSSRDQTSEVKVPANSLQSLPSEGAEREVPSCLFFFL